ncbi:four-carbon acid sugar kinase family protein [Amaricoccus sp.]|uniref:four-carbon acid sugar kinase family protein n=1 Tax=Amaricoccus sp. TaxID=1872485 RepID=UPI0025C5B67F|nr:four-carbon acid sugar kinase family protein [Amaricoccus sp.]
MTGAAAPLPEGLLVAWYGDDFTGSAAVMEVLTFAGLPSALFFDPPTPAQLARFRGLRGIGIASTARAHGPAWMDRELPAVFETLRGLAAPISHYKICSTLDSAPEVGSIGRAVDIALPILGSAWAPILAAAPPMRRYQAFGSLFASGPGGVARLDRHPVMARHPVTPMDEADVARHLSRQTARPIGLIDLEALADPAAAEAARQAQVAAGRTLLSLDCIDAASLSACGRLIWEARGPGQLAVGSQGVEYALTRYWRDAGLIPEAPPAAGIGPAGRMAVVSGSVSPITAAQIDWSEANGFAGIAFDARAVVDAAALAAAEAAAVEAALAAIGAGRDPLVYTARGPDDPAVPALRAALDASGVTAEAANARIGAALGRILDAVVRRAGLRRAVISGGDTSGHASRQLGVHALTALAPTIPGAAIFRAHGEGAHDGLELALKGGQMGSPDYFGWVRDGGGPRSGPC